MQIPNGCNTEFFHPIAKKQLNSGKIIFIGKLNPMKGVHILIECFALLRAEHLDIKLEIIGDGPDRKKLENMTKTLEISKAVCFYGEIKDVKKHLQEADLFVLPSFSEGLPNVILEAMSSGLPVIATRTGGIPDIIEDGSNGILVEPRNSDQLYKAISRILTNEKLAEQLSLKARETIESRFSIDHIARQYIKLYNKLTSSS
jgi:glycosyltransferase involved in cell wall biosynthesis